MSRWDSRLKLPLALFALTALAYAGCVQITPLAAPAVPAPAANASPQQPQQCPGGPAIDNDLKRCGFVEAAPAAAPATAAAAAGSSPAAELKDSKVEVKQQSAAQPAAGGAAPASTAAAGAGAAPASAPAQAAAAPAAAPAAADPAAALAAALAALGPLLPAPKAKPRPAAPSPLVAQVMEVGYDREVAELGVTGSRNGGLARALDWLLTHSADVDRLRARMDAERAEEKAYAAQQAQVAAITKQFTAPAAAAAASPVVVPAGVMPSAGRVRALLHEFESAAASLAFSDADVAKAVEVSE
jgi:hypothetical protein